MKIRIRATGRFTPKSKRPTFEYWINGKYVTECYESVINTEEVKNGD